MALNKTVKVDKIEIVGDYKHVQVRTATVIDEDGTELSRSFHRKILSCGQLDSSNNLVDTDVTGETTEVQAICNTVWITSVKNAWKAKLIADKSSTP